MHNKPDIQQVRDALPIKIEDLSFLDDGGHKIVYKGTVNNSVEAIKLIFIPSSASVNEEEIVKENIYRAKREIDILRKIKCLSLVKLGTIKPTNLTIGGFNFILYSEEYIAGKNLSYLIKNKYSPDQNELNLLCKSLINCVYELNNNSIVHRDIKPLNIIKTNITNRPFVLLDLGIAFIVDSTNYTIDSRLVPGTTPYLAPEFFHDGFRDRLDFRADLYCIGLTIYEFATSTHPFKAYHRDNTLSNIRDITPVSLKVKRPDLNDSFCKLIDSWLKKKPMLRQSDFNNIYKIIET